MANLRTNNLSGEQGQNAYRGSVQFNDADYLQIADSADIEIGSNDYTVEFWAIFTKVSSSTAYEEIVNKGYPFQIYRNTSNNQILLAVDSNTDTYEINTSFGTPEVGHWHHIAVSRSGNTTKGFVNGIGGLSSTSNTSIHDGSTAFTIGTYGASTGDYQFRGVISNVRVVIGTALYTADFTPPTEELTIVDGTAILCCQDSNDPTQEATGKTITGFGNLATAGYLETQPKVIPPYGVDAGNAFGGPIQQSSQGYMYFPTGRTEERGRGRAVIFAGSVTPVSPNFSSNIDYIEMRSSGVGVRFGNCTGNSFHGSCGSSTRGFMFGGQIGSPDVQTNLIEFVTIATEGNSTDFGDLLRAKRRLNGQGHSNKTRAILAGGGGDAPLAPDNVIQFFTMASTGDATDFGDLNAAKDNSAGTGSPTRMLIAGGRDYTPSATVVNKIEYITMSTTGNVTDFGDLTVARAELARASNAVRSVFVSGGTPSPKVNTIDFVTTATTGDATDFGDLPIAKGGMASANNSIIGIFVAGTTGSRTTDIQSLTIATTGNGVAFGDCNVTDPSQGREGCSDSHGGLS